MMMVVFIVRYFFVSAWDAFPKSNNITNLNLQYFIITYLLLCLVCVFSVLVLSIDEIYFIADCRPNLLY